MVTHRARRYWIWTLAALVWATATVLATKAPPANSQPPVDRRTTHGRAFKPNKAQVKPGDLEGAEKYYKKTVVPHLAFSTEATIMESALADLLKYFGYDNVTATQLHELPSADLMAKSGGTDILATRFFAPKISNVSDTGQTPADGYGWRKLVRFKAKAGSKAEANGMETLWFLQNTFAASPTDDPFDPTKNVSRFNQAMVVRKGPPSAGKNAAYFFAYQSLVKVKIENGKISIPPGDLQESGKLGVSLGATFDEGDRDPETNLGPNDYFVPDACIQCHGRSGQLPKLNFLDTDHWFDRVTPAYGLPESKFSQEDFTAIAGSPFGVLYDGGKDPATDRFKKAFAVIRALNTEIADQNRRVGGSHNFQLQAVQRWLQLHAPDQAAEGHVTPAQRGFGAEVWDGNDVSQRMTLYYLNRYCYRCHSSVVFNVYDLATVRDKAQAMRERLLFIGSSQPDKWMPQDRIVPGLQIVPGDTGTAVGDLLEFIELLKKLKPDIE